MAGLWNILLRLSLYILKQAIKAFFGDKKNEKQRVKDVDNFSFQSRSSHERAFQSDSNNDENDKHRLSDDIRTQKRRTLRDASVRKRKSRTPQDSPVCKRKIRTVQDVSVHTITEGNVNEKQERNTRQNVLEIIQVDNSKAWKRTEPANANTIMIADGNAPARSYGTTSLEKTMEHECSHSDSMHSPIVKNKLHTLQDQINQLTRKRNRSDDELRSLLEENIFLKNKLQNMEDKVQKIQENAQEVRWIKDENRIQLLLQDHAKQLVYLLSRYEKAEKECKLTNTGLDQITKEKMHLHQALLKVQSSLV